jgi:flavorubredoxin
MTTIDEIGDRIYRIHTPVREIPGGFSLNQILVDDDEPLLFHTGGRRMFGDVRAAIERVIPITKLRWIGFSHVEFRRVRRAERAPRRRAVCHAFRRTRGRDDRPGRLRGPGRASVRGR